MLPQQRPMTIGGVATNLPDKIYEDGEDSAKEGGARRHSIGDSLLLARSGYFLGTCGFREQAGSKVCVRTGGGLGRCEILMDTIRPGASSQAIFAVAAAKGRATDGGGHYIPSLEKAMSKERGLLLQHCRFPEARLGAFLPPKQGSPGTEAVRRQLRLPHPLRRQEYGLHRRRGGRRGGAGPP